MSRLHPHAVLAAVAALGLALTQPALAADPAHGESLFQDRCSMCHMLGGQGQGPDLNGVVGRKAASVAGFNYTPALSASGLTWTPANLDRFLTDPRAMVPGTAMRAHLAQASDRADLIAFVASHHGH